MQAVTGEEERVVLAEKSRKQKYTASYNKEDINDMTRQKKQNVVISRLVSTYG